MDSVSSLTKEQAVSKSGKVATSRNAQLSFQLSRDHRYNFTPLLHGMETLAEITPLQKSSELHAPTTLLETAQAHIDIMPAIRVI